MSSTYQKPITIPGDFPAILKAFTREILRAQVKWHQTRACTEVSR